MYFNLKYFKNQRDGNQNGVVLHDRVRYDLKHIPQVTSHINNDCVYVSVSVLLCNAMQCNDRLLSNLTNIFICSLYSC